MSEAWEREAEWLDRVGRWIALHPITGSAAARQLADEICAELEALGFAVEARGRAGRSPLLVARRVAGPHAPTLGIYGHYDVEPIHGSWRSDARRLRIEQQRAYGRGIADNLGPLAARLLAVRDVCCWPNVLWVLEGEEESGSPRLAKHLDALRAGKIALWIDETGYFEAPGCQRILTSRRDARLDALCTIWKDLAAETSTSVVFESRELNRASAVSVGPVSHLFAGWPYAAIGPNDEAANVHAGNESLPLATLALCARQFVATLEHLAAEVAA